MAKLCPNHVDLNKKTSLFDVQKAFPREFWQNFITDRNSDKIQRILSGNFKILCLL
jgi:hypothetical protein